MPTKRTSGEVQPGIKWGKFTLRVPLIHTRATVPELLQGIAVPGASAMALAPLMVAYFGLSFYEAIYICMLHALLLSSSWMFFGEPYAPGWLTPAMPLIFTFVLGSNYDHVGMFQLMTALSLSFAAILLFLGFTGLGVKLIERVPRVLKAGIILGASIAAFKHVFDYENTANTFFIAPIASTCGLAVCVAVTFSKPLNDLALKQNFIAYIIKLGLLPGFIVAGTVGYFTGEFSFEIQSGVIPIRETAVSVWNKTSPFVIGWPSLAMFIQAFPLALITYTLFFGDLLTGDEMIRQAQISRPDETIEINNARTHLSTGFRNVMLSIISPFFGTQGVLWTGVQAIIIKRWSQGREEMDSLFDGISSYYSLGGPKLILFFFLPYVTFLKPLLPVALAVTLILTGLSCAILALSLIKDSTEKAVVVLIAISLSAFEPWIGMLVAIATILIVIGPKASFLSREITDSNT